MILHTTNIIYIMHMRTYLYVHVYIGDYNIATFIDHCQAQDPMIQVAEEYIFAARASLMLRGNNTVIIVLTYNENCYIYSCYLYTQSYTELRTR